MVDEGELVDVVGGEEGVEDVFLYFVREVLEHHVRMLICFFVVVICC